MGSLQREGKTWKEVLQLYLTSRVSVDSDTGPELNGYGAWLVSLLISLQCDWRDECLQAERKDLAFKAEKLRHELRELGAASSESPEEMAKLNADKVSKSAEFMQTYQSLRGNMMSNVDERKGAKER